jgi:type VI secretion system protein ImpH
MASSRRRTGSCLGDLLLAEGFRCEFFQAVRLWQAAERGRVPVGEGDLPEREPLRFRTNVSFAFPTSEIEEMRLAPEQDGRAELTINFMGVATPGSYGSLPTPFTEDVAIQDRSREPALHEFLDLFNHRFISLFHRAWEKNRPAVISERLTAGEVGLFETAMRGLMGLATDGARASVALPDALILGRAGMLRPGLTSADGLADLVEKMFGVPARVEQFVARWFALEAEDCSRLGREGSRLGVDFILGDRVPLAQSRFRLVLGPLPWDAFQSLLPCGEAHDALHQLVELAAGPELTFDILLDLGAADVPPLQLGSSAAPPRLGWTTWLGTARDPAATQVVVGSPAAA